MIRVRDQRGMTLVELLVSMAVMSIILVGLTGVYFNVTQRYQGWADRIGNASVGASLAASIQSDSHRYVPCVAFSHLETFGFCPGDDLSTWAVQYMVSGAFPYTITRQARGGSPTLLARSVNVAQPNIWADCFDAGATVSGHVHVYNLRIDDGSGSSTVSSENFSVYYVAPWRPGCS